MRYFYPQEQQELFTNRQMELAELAHYRDTLLHGQPEHVALFGPRRIGKTLLLKEFLRQTLEQKIAVAPAYMDFTFLCSSPEQFAAGYVGHICYWLVTQGGDSNRVAQPTSSSRRARPLRYHPTDYAPAGAGAG